MHSNLYSDKITHYLVCRDIYVQAVKSNGGPGREKKGLLRRMSILKMHSTDKPNT